MTNDFSGSAKIYTFPPRGRFAANGQRDANTKAIAQIQLPPGAKLVVGGAWYHDAAIAEANAIEPDRNN